jgi:hypothetical protein
MEAFAVFNIVTAVVALASAVANVTKTDADNKVIANISKFVNVLALNFFNVKK